MYSNSVCVSDAMVSVCSDAMVSVCQWRHGKCAESRSTRFVNKVCLPHTLGAPSIDLVSIRRDPEGGPEEELLTAMEADDTPRETKLRRSLSLSLSLRRVYLLKNW